MLRDMNLAVAANDDRAIEVLASGLPLFFGAQFAADATVRSVLLLMEEDNGVRKLSSLWKGWPQ